MMLFIKYKKKRNKLHNMTTILRLKSMKQKDKLKYHIHGSLFKNSESE